MSPATELADRTEKRREYQRLASLRHYVLVAQDTPRVEVYTRTAEGWQFEEIEGLDAILPLAAFEITVPLAEVYDGLSLRPLSEPAASD